MRTLKGSDDEELLSEAGKATVGRLILYIKYIQAWIHVEGMTEHRKALRFLYLQIFQHHFCAPFYKKHDPAKILSCA